MEQVARSLGAQIGSIIGILWLAWTIWVTYHYSNDELELRGSVSYLQVAFAHIIVYRIFVELCQRETYCVGDTNLFRWWGMLVLIHYSTAWVLFLRTRRRILSVIRAREHELVEQVGKLKLEIEGLRRKGGAGE